MEPINDEGPDDVIEAVGLSRYRKAITVVVGATIAFASLIITDDHAGIQPSEWLAGAIMYATAFGVYKIPNAK